MATKSKARTKKKRECPTGYHKVYSDGIGEQPSKHKREDGDSKPDEKRKFKCVKTKEHGTGALKDDWRKEAVRRADDE